MSFPNQKSVFLQILHHSSVSWNILLCTFLAQTLYTLFKRSPLKCKFLGLSSARVKICQIPHVNFETKSQLFFKFASFFIVMIDIFFVNFKLIYFLLWVKGSHQSSSFENFKCSGGNLLYSSCHFPNHKSVSLQILPHPLVLWEITSLYFLGQTLYSLHKRN